MYLPAHDSCGPVCGAQLVVSVLTDPGGSEPAPGLVVAKRGQEGVLAWLKKTRIKNDPNQVEEAVVDEATKSVFIKWRR